MKNISSFKFQVSSFGFTLIELLVVISIIGILATLIMANFMGVRERARDAQRKSDVNQIQKAIQMYYADNRSWPSPVGCPCGDTNCPIPSDDPGRWAQLSTLLVPKYIQTLPTDPTWNGVQDIDRPNQYTYGCKTVSGNLEYELEAILENKSDNDAQKDGGSANNLYEKGTSLTINPRSWFGPPAP